MSLTCNVLYQTYDGCRAEASQCTFGQYKCGARSSLTFLWILAESWYRLISSTLLFLGLDLWISLALQSRCFVFLFSSSAPAGLSSALKISHTRDRPVLLKCGKSAGCWRMDLSLKAGNKFSLSKIVPSYFPRNSCTRNGFGDVVL